jgi:hypothetical protein
MPVYSCHDKGDVLSKRKNTMHEYYRISFDVSKKDFDDFNGQVEDAISFLQQYDSELKCLLSTHKIQDVYLDFALYSRLYGDVINQNDHLPKELIALAGKYPIGIEMALYAKGLFEEE